MAGKPNDRQNSKSELICAVPKYLQGKLNSDVIVPPGHRFNLYAQLWNDRFEAATKDAEKEAAKTKVVNKAAEQYPNEIKDLLNCVASRQLALAKQANTYVLPCELTSPLAIGLGNPHPIENGFSFLKPYGLPYIAGSGVKGVFRRAAEALAQDEGCENPKEAQHIKDMFGYEGDKNKKNKAKADKDGKNTGSDEDLSGALSFWDIFPTCTEMTAEIMTPHYSEYYQGGSLNEQGQPNPIVFLAVKANSRMNIIIQAKNNSRLPSDWRQKIKEIAEYAGKWLGFGAKTSVGYGAFRLDEEKLKKMGEEKEQQLKDAEKLKAQEEAQRRLAAMSPEERQAAEKEMKLNELYEQFKEIRSKEKTYNPGPSALGRIWNDIIKLGTELKSPNTKIILEDIKTWIKDNKKKKAEINELLRSFPPA